MTYQKQNFADGQVLKAEHLNHMEDGIEAVTNKIPAIGANGNWYIGTEDSGVSATGPAGKDGYTPVKGVDYYTEADKTEMVSAVMAALPVGEGVAY